MVTLLKALVGLALLKLVLFAVLAALTHSVVKAALWSMALVGLGAALLASRRLPQRMVRLS